MRPLQSCGRPSTRKTLGIQLVSTGMSLEDHVGSILKKARTARGLTLLDGARLAGVPQQEYEALETTGLVRDRCNLFSLCDGCGLNLECLEQIARGWLPMEPDLTAWRELRRITTREGGITVHCYLLWDEATRDAALFDTGFDATPVFQLIEENELQLRHLFITHTHDDHIAALAAIRRQLPAARLHSSSSHAPVEQRNRATDFIHVGSLRITNRATPGHSEDGASYVIGNFPEDAPHAAVVGDAIFAGSIGSLPAGRPEGIMTVQNHVLTLPAETLLCPGHGPFTTVAQEKMHNPFFARPTPN